MALRLEGEGKATHAINSSVQDDMLNSITQEQASVANIKVRNEQESQLRRQTLAAVSQAMDAVISSQEISDAGVPRSQALSQLQHAIQTLEALKKQLGDGQ
ncbi:hypothetical protein AB6813_00550 [bacterium RCC_150]